ncbi:uncharacterized protein ARMOST_15206 [Armillaria ostoyae]|uniref:Tetratricopeptide repeat protein 29 n=1 Tax=Armillaria ostoyae TaxID=47428 RepID=A0A284RSR3_ARMOS|nr:uncharacterized protein ARMOST_15206 [Armillaria ostoyae]
MQAPSQPLTQSPSTAVPDRSAILAPPNLAPDDTNWISAASLTFKVLAGAGELDRTGIAKAIANIALPILELVQDNKKARDELKDTIKYLDEMLTYVSKEIKLLQEGQSLMDASTRPLAHLKQMGNEFICHLKDLKDDLNKIYGKTGFRAKMKKPFQGKAILDHINQHKMYIKDARDKLVATAVLSTARQVTDIHNHLLSPSRTHPVNNIMLSAIPPPSSSVFMGRDNLVQEGITNLLAESPCSIIIMGFGGQYSEATVKLEKAMQMFKDIGASLRAAQCLRSLGDILEMTNQYSEATVKLKKAMQMFKDIRHSLGTAQCLQSLGKILQTTNQYSEATVMLEKAMQMFEDIGASFGTAQCLRSLGDILRMTNQYSEATVKLEKAMQMFESIGNSHEVTQCLESLRYCQDHIDKVFGSSTL